MIDNNTETKSDENDVVQPGNGLSLFAFMLGLALGAIAALVYIYS